MGRQRYRYYSSISIRQKTNSDESNNLLKMMQDDFILKTEDSILFIINDNMINGRTRFQKYGFLLFKQYQNELKNLQNHYDNFKFYDDWVPHNFGPYSENLQKDLDTCITNKIIREFQSDKTSQYSLTLKGRVRWRKLLNLSDNEVKKINEKISNLQTYSLFGLLKSIYDAYPDYAVNSKIKNQLD